MIIFNLDGTLSDCEHRRHFVDPIKAKCIQWVNTQTGKTRYGNGYENGIFNEFKTDWKSFYEACHMDLPIQPVIHIFDALAKKYGREEVRIWSGRCESVVGKTLSWLTNHSLEFHNQGILVKMRLIGDNTPDDELKERWLDEFLNLPKMDTVNGICNNIDFVFDSDPKSIEMWRRRGIFVFDCNQMGKEF